MDTLQPILKRGRDVWDQINMPKQEFLLRINQVRNYMKKHRISLFLIYGYGTDHCADICYLTNFQTKMNVSAVLILPRDGEPTLFFEGPSRELKTGQRITWIEDIRSSLSGAFSPSGSLAKNCLKFLNGANLIPSKIGLVGVRQFMPFQEYKILIEGLKGCKVLEVDDLFKELRMKKSKTESDQIRRASRIVNTTLNFISDLVLNKMDERIFEAKIDWFARIQGAEDIRILFANSGESNWSLRPSKNRLIKQDEKVSVYLALSFERYWVEGIKTFVAKDSKLIEINNENVKELYQNVIKGIRPGKLISEFYQEVMKIIKASGFIYVPEYVLINGIGLSLEEPPFLKKASNQKFLEDMCVALRLTVKDKDGEYFIFGDTILIHEHSNEVLTQGLF